MEKNWREYNTQRPVGVWLVYIGAVIILSAILGGDLYIQPLFLGFGFVVGYFLIFGLPYVSNKLAYGKNSKEQDRIENYAIVFNVVFCTLCGLIIGFNNPRLLWLSIFIVVGIHFLGFYFSQGKLMILLGILTVINSLIGIFLVTIPFLLLAVVDGILKIIFGLKFLFAKRPSANSI